MALNIGRVAVCDLIKELLIDNPETRDSDELLYVSVCRNISPESVNLPFAEVVLNGRERGIPSFETVRRTRQKIQESYPELRGSLSVQARREANRQKFIRFARSKI